MELKPDPGARRKLKAAARVSARALPGHLPPAFFMTDPGRVPDPAAVAAKLPRGWGVIYRHFGSADRAQTAKALRQITARRAQSLLIANDPALAMETKADGVHWPELSVSQAKYWQGRFAIMTASAHSRRAIMAARLSGVDAAIVSVAFPSNSPSAGSSMGSIKFRTLSRDANMPTYALGGVTAQTAGAIASGSGICGIDGFMAAFGH